MAGATAKEAKPTIPIHDHSDRLRPMNNNYDNQASTRAQYVLFLDDRDKTRVFSAKGLSLSQSGEAHDALQAIQTGMPCGVTRRVC